MALGEPVRQVGEKIGVAAKKVGRLQGKQEKLLGMPQVILEMRSKKERRIYYQAVPKLLEACLVNVGDRGISTLKSWIEVWL